MSGRSLSPLSVDGLVAAGLAALCVVTAPYLPGVATTRAVDALGYLLILVSCAAVAIRRIQPVWSILITATGVSVYLSLSYPYGFVMASLAIAVYSVARYRGAGEAAVWSGVSLALLWVHLLTNAAALDGPAGLIPALAWICVPFTMGLARRMILEASAATRRERDQRLVDAERLRVAQEVHDIIGHGLAAIQMQADVALHLGTSAPEQSRRALQAISRSSAAALAELRTTLDQVGSAVVAETRRAAAGLDRLPELVDRVADAGVQVQLTVTGQRPALPEAVQTTLYRVVQESLTNVLKHSTERQAQVAIDYQATMIRLTVISPDPFGGSFVEGLGIRGMRRRAEPCGGTVTVESSDGRFTVLATLPIPE